MSRSDQPAILGGAKVRTSQFPPRVTMGAKEKEAAVRVVESDVLSAFIGGAGQFFGGGDHVRRFEHNWASSYGFKHAISVNSWTTGLVTCIGAAGVEPGDEVICSPYTMSASATCALFYGGIPVFADINPETFALDPDAVEARITERTKAIVLVHLFGYPANVEQIMEIARPRGVKVIEDAAQAPGVYRGGKAVGAIGDMGGFSLNFHKHIHTGEGGMIVTQDDEVAERCRLIRNHGENVVASSSLQDISNTIGSNYRLTELQAAVGIEQLRKLPALLEERMSLASHMNKRLAEIDGLTPQNVPADSTHAYYVYPIRFDAKKIGLSRHLFLKSVLAELPAPDGFEGTALTEGYVRPLYHAPVYQQKIAIGKKGFPFNCNPGIDYDYQGRLCPTAERMYEEELLLSPIIREPLTLTDIDDLADAIAKVVNNSATIAAEITDDSQGEVFTPVNAAVDTNVR